MRHNRNKGGTYLNMSEQFGLSKDDYGLTYKKRGEPQGKNMGQ